MNVDKPHHNVTSGQRYLQGASSKCFLRAEPAALLLECLPPVDRTIERRIGQRQERWKKASFLEHHDLFLGPFGRYIIFTWVSFFFGADQHWLEYV